MGSGNVSRSPNGRLTLPTGTTPAQRARRDLILRVATGILITGGEASLQMKDVAERAEVSLRTLYRYFPSKEHLLLSISLSRYEEAMSELAGETPVGATPGARVEAHLLREFRAEQRYPLLTAALLRASTDTDRAYVDLLEKINKAHLDILESVAEAGQGSLPPDVRRLLPVVAHVFASAARSWFAGVRSSAEVQQDIGIGARLLDLPAQLIRSEVLADKHSPPSQFGDAAGR